MNITLFSILLLLLWLACGVLGAGFSFASSVRRKTFLDDLTSSFPNDNRLKKAVETVKKENNLWWEASEFIRLFSGPIGLIAALVDFGFYGFHGFLWPWGKKAKRETGL